MVCSRIAKTEDMLEGAACCDAPCLQVESKQSRDHHKTNPTIYHNLDSMGKGFKSAASAQSWVENRWIVPTWVDRLLPRLVWPH